MMGDNKLKKLKVGQKLFLVRNYGPSIEVEIEKVGRKWAQLDNRYRINIETMCVDGGGGNSPGRCYFSEVEYRQKVESDNFWRNFIRKVNQYNWNTPSGITVDDMRDAAKILKINLDE
jgi:hypothetical protein